MPGARLSSLLLKAHPCPRPSPDESHRGEALSQCPAGMHPDLLGVQGAGGRQGGSSTSFRWNGIRGIHEHPEVLGPGKPAAGRHKAVPPCCEAGGRAGGQSALLPPELAEARCTGSVAHWLQTSFLAKRQVM